MGKKIKQDNKQEIKQDNKGMKVSVIITAYNVEEYIEQAMRSVLEQTYDNLELIVVLDKPTDHTASVVYTVAEKNYSGVDVRIIDNEENIGPGLSRRRGIEAATGEYFLLLDGDDYLDKDFIATLVSRAMETGADIVSGGIRVLNMDGTWKAESYGTCVTEGADKVSRFWGERIVFMNNKIIRRKLHDVVPYCHRRYIEDTPVIIPMLWHANRVAYADTIGYTYRMRSGSLTHEATPIKDIIYKGLCWCDLMDFFNQYDKSMFDALPVKQYVSNIFEAINQTPIFLGDVEPYISDWLELTLRLPNLVSVKQIDFK